MKQERVLLCELENGLKISYQCFDQNALVFFSVDKTRSTYTYMCLAYMCHRDSREAHQRVSPTDEC